MSDTTPDVPNDQPAPEWTWPEEWAGFDADLPSVLADPVKKRLTATQERYEREIAAARQESLPAEWAPLIQQAQEQKVSPDEFREAIQFAATQRQMLAEDPYGFIYGVEAQIDQMVESGQITLAEGKTAKRKAAAAIADQQQQGEDFRTDDQKRLDDLQEWRAQQEAAAEQEREQRELELEEQEIEAASEATADEFVSYFDQTLTSTGLSGASEATRKAFADVAMGYMARDDEITPKEAIDAALQLFQAEVAARRTSQPQRMPIGGSPSSAVQAVEPQPQTAADRRAAMIAAAQAAAAS